MVITGAFLNYLGTRDWVAHVAQNLLTRRLNKISPFEKNILRDSGANKSNKIVAILDKL